MQEKVFVARHMRNLSLKLMEAGHKICRELDPVLEPTWASLLSAMQGGQTITVTEAAKRLDVSHVHAQKVLKAMLSAGAAQARPDPADGRSTLYQLTQDGERLVPVVGRLTAAIQGVLEDIERETGHDLAAALRSFERVLEKRDWQSRVSEKIDSEEKE